MYSKKRMLSIGERRYKKLSITLMGLRVFVVDTRIELVLHA